MLRRYARLLPPPASAQEAREPSCTHVRRELGPSLGVALGQSRGPRGVDRERHAPLGDAGDLRRVDEPLAAAGVDHDPVEDVLALVLEHLTDLTDLDPIRG